MFSYTDREELLKVLWAVPEAAAAVADSDTDEFVLLGARLGLSMRQMWVLVFLRQYHPTEWVSPTAVAREMWPGINRDSAWASPKLKALVAHELVDRHERGSYRLRAPAPLGDR